MKPYALAIFLLMSGIVRAEPAAMLILPFANATTDRQLDSLSAGLPELLTVCFSGFHQMIRIVDRSSLDALIDEQALKFEHYTAGSALQDLGQMTGADYVLRGSITGTQAGHLVQALVFDTGTTALAVSAEAPLDGGDLVENLCKGIAAPLLQQLETRQSSVQSLIVDQTPEKQQLLMLGLTHYYNGNYAQALAPFLKLVKAYRADPVPHYWLARSFHGAGLDDFARLQLTEHLEIFPESPRRESVIALLGMLDVIKDNED